MKNWKRFLAAILIVLAGTNMNSCSSPQDKSETDENNNDPTTSQFGDVQNDIEREKLPIEETENQINSENLDYLTSDEVKEMFDFKDGTTYKFYLECQEGTLEYADLVYQRSITTNASTINMPQALEENNPYEAKQEMYYFADGEGGELYIKQTIMFFPETDTIAAYYTEIASEIPKPTFDTVVLDIGEGEQVVDGGVKLSTFTYSLTVEGAQALAPSCTMATSSYVINNCGEVPIRKPGTTSADSDNAGFAITWELPMEKVPEEMNTTPYVIKPIK